MTLASITSTETAARVIPAMKAGTVDIRFGEYRFIHKDAIDAIMQEELASDASTLGALNPTFLQDAIGVDSALIESLQFIDACEAVATLIKAKGKLEAVQRHYVECDGYAHHFGASVEAPDMVDYHGFIVS